MKVERFGSSKGGWDFMLGSAQGAAGKVKVRDWYFAGTQRNAKTAQNIRQQCKGPGWGSDSWR